MLFDTTDHVLVNVACGLTCAFSRCMYIDIYMYSSSSVMAIIYCRESLFYLIGKLHRIVFVLGIL